MRLVLCSLLALWSIQFAPAQSSRQDDKANLDGQWALVQMEVNGHSMSTGHPYLAIKNNRLVLNESRTLPPIILEFGAGHSVRMWTPDEPKANPTQSTEEIVPYGDPVSSPGRRQWVIDPVSGAAIIAPTRRIETHSRDESLSYPGCLLVGRTASSRPWSSMAPNSDRTGRRQRASTSSWSRCRMRSGVT